MVNSLRQNEERRGVSYRSNLDVNVPNTQSQLRVRQLKWSRTFRRYGEMVSQTIQHAEELPFPWVPRSLDWLFKENHRSPLTLSVPYLTNPSLPLSRQKVWVQMPRGENSNRGENCRVYTQKTRVPLLTSLTSSGTPSQGNGGSHKYSISVAEFARAN